MFDRVLNTPLIIAEVPLVSEKSLFDDEVLYLEPFQKPMIELLCNNYFFGTKPPS